MAMTPEQIAAAEELRVRLREVHEAKIRLGQAARRVRDTLRRPEVPALLRRQAG